MLVGRVKGAGQDDPLAGFGIPGPTGHDLRRSGLNGRLVRGGKLTGEDVDRLKDDEGGDGRVGGGNGRNLVSESRRSGSINATGMKKKCSR